MKIVLKYQNSKKIVLRNLKLNFALAMHNTWHARSQCTSDFGLRLALGPTSLLQLLYLYMKNCNYTVEPEIIFSLLRRIVNSVQRVSKRKNQFQKIHPMYFYSKKGPRAQSFVSKNFFTSKLVRGH